MGDFKRLVAWQQAHAFAAAVDEAVADRKADTATGSRAQILCAESSMTDDIAYGSAKEVEGQLLKARDLNLLTVMEADDLLRLGDRVSKLCFGLSRSSKPS